MVDFHETAYVKRSFLIKVESKLFISTWLVIDQLDKNEKSRKTEKSRWNIREKLEMRCNLISK